VISSGKANQTVSDAGGPIANHSVFTGHLLKALSGEAAGFDGVLTASNLMSHVANAVGSDVDSHQTPHYGQIFGDGDFIISKIPDSTIKEETEETELDTLVAVVSESESRNLLELSEVIASFKELLSSDTNLIALHDFSVSQVRKYISDIETPGFETSGQFSTEGFFDRLALFEEAGTAVFNIFATLSYWANSNQNMVLEKSLRVLSDKLHPTSGNTGWIECRWLPILMSFYSSGIGAMASKNYTCLRSLFFTEVPFYNHNDKRHSLIKAMTHTFSEMSQMKLFKQIEGQERMYTPISNYLLTMLQPRIEEALFLGSQYEEVFDEFEAFFCLVAYYESYKQEKEWAWAPFGRFGWKDRRSNQNSLVQMMDKASAEGDSWPPLLAGFFDGQYSKFLPAAEAYLADVKKLEWF